MENIKRERCINWEREEKQLLRNIIRPYLAIIENKDLSTNKNKEKIKAWTEITERFNVANVRIRDKKQLMNQWKCLKLNSKKELASYRRETSKTGGGPKPPSPSLETIEVTEMIPQAFEVDSNEFDCDGIQDITDNMHIKSVDVIKPEKSTDVNIMNDKDVTEAIILDSDIPKADHTKQHQTSTPNRQKSSTKTRKTSKDDFRFGEASYTDMHQFRMLESERLQKEHELKMKNMVEIHNQMMINLKLQNEIYKKYLESIK